jgi:hypothetical protein
MGQRFGLSPLNFWSGADRERFLAQTTENLHVADVALYG